MCNFYSRLIAGGDAPALRRAIDRVGNLPPLLSIYPDYPAPIIRNSAEGREVVMARWDMPTRPQYQAGKKVDRGVTNIRQTNSSRWRGWLGPEHRCLIPFTSSPRTRFSPTATVRPVWFAFDETRPLAFFAGTWARWTSGRKLKEGQITADFYGMLTTEPNAEVGAIDPKAIPAILTEPPEWEVWLKAH